MRPCVLLVDDQRSILHLLHSALNTMGHDLEIIEAPSGEEALLSAQLRKIDLVVSDYLLPGITGIELIHKIRARHPDVKVVLISGITSRKAREQMLNAGAAAVFDKPIPMADFIDVIERSLGLVRTVFPPETGDLSISRRGRLSELLVNFRQDLDAHAVFLVSDRGRVVARAGALRDDSMEVSLISSLMAVYGAGLKVARLVHQDHLDNYHVFSGGDDDLILIPVDSSYSLLLAGPGMASPDRVLETVQAMLALRRSVEQALTQLGVTGPLPSAEEPVAAVPLASTPVQETPQPDEAAASPEMEDLLKQAAASKIKAEEVDDFWDQAAQKHGHAPENPSVLTYEQARKLGLLPGDEK